MPTTQYPNNPNTDTVFVTDDNNHRTRAVKTVQMDGTIDYPTNPNSDSCYVTVDGKKQRALMVADISSEGTLDYPKNSNSTKGYVTVNGKKQRVTLTASLVGGGSAPVIDELNVTPSTSAQTITAPSGVDGYTPVNVSAVDSTIDPNIVAGNIKKDVQILGVRGSYEGTTPTGSISITNNGTYDVTDKATAVVNVPTTAPAMYREFQLSNTGKLEPNKTTTHIMDFTGVTDIGEYALMYVYADNTAISGVIDMSDLITVSGSSACNTAFRGCTGLTGVDLSALTKISGSSACNSMFGACAGLTSIDLSSLTTISGSSACNSMFSGCRGLTNVILNSLTTIGGLYITNCCQYMFQNCIGLTSMNFPALTTINSGYGCSYMFTGCTSLTSLSFPALISTGFGTNTNQFNNMLTGVTGCTVHFPSNLQSVIGSWTSVTSGFGGTNTTVLFDLPATES